MDSRRSIRIVMERPAERPPLQPWRCPACGGMLARVSLAPGSVVQVKCHRCNSIATKEAA